jgi:hypothetical protein
MSQFELVNALNSLSLADRLSVIEMVLVTVRRELTANAVVATSVTTEQTQMKLAADALFDDYKNDKELVVFTALDPEDFYEAR